MVPIQNEKIFEKMSSQGNTKKRTFPITVVYPIKENDIKSLLISAFEGGSNYWCVVEKRISIRDTSKTSLYNIVLKGDGLIISNRKICTKGDGEYIQRPLTLGIIKSGLALMAENSPASFADILNDNADGETGDIFLQYCLFGEVIYG